MLSTISTWYKAAHLRKLLKEPPGTTGRRLSGEEIIKQKSEKILANCYFKPNPIASALGLGDCQIDRHDRQIRPSIGMTANIPGQKKGLSYRPRSYYITKVAQDGAPPYLQKMQYSHRCHQPSCLNPKHGEWETTKVNLGRCKCNVGDSHFLFEQNGVERFLLPLCKHKPVCLSGSVIRNMEHRKITQLPT